MFRAFPVREVRGKQELVLPEQLVEPPRWPRLCIMKEMLAAQNDDIVPIKPQKVEVLDWQDLNIINR